MEILHGREETYIAGKDLSLDALYEVGTSAGGNHSKAVIAINKQTGDIRSGQIMLPEGYTYYLLKFAETRYYPLTQVEMAYADMAKIAGIQMMPSQLIEIGNEWHFLTERYDRKAHELHLYKPSTCDFIIEPHDIRVENAHWEEMSNGAKRLTAKLNGTEYKGTVSPKSHTGKAMIADGGIKMSQEAIKRYVEELLIPKHLDLSHR